MKKLFAVLLSVLLLCGIMTPAFAAEEIPDGYMPICTAEDLNSIRNNLDGNYILMNDIDLSGVGNWTPIGKETAPFSGILIGNNHTIQNLTITVTQEQPASLAGLFGCIKDAYLAGFALDQISLSIENPIYETIAAGGIAALGISGAISNCSVSGTIRAVGGRGLFIGGLVGWGLSPLVPSAQTLEIINCKNASNLTVIGKLEQEPPFDYGDNYIFNHTYVGGLVGCHENAILRQCSNSGSIEVQALYDACIGGVIGFAQWSELTACANLGAVDLTVENETTSPYENCISGGVCGLLSGNLSDCRNAGRIVIEAVDQLVHLGGLVGRLTDGTVITSYNFGILTAFATAEPPLIEAHALIGSYEVFDLEASDSAANEHILNCYYLDKEQDSFGTALSLQEFQETARFVGFDFENVWKLPEGAAMPLLWYEGESRTIIEKAITLKTGQTIAFETDGALVIDAVSGNPEIAAVAGNKITGNRTGTTTIRATLADGTELHCAVTVRFSLIGWLWSLIHSFLRSVF